MDEQRDRMRQVLKKLAFAKNAKATRGGLLRDISARGAALDFVNPMGKADHSFEVDDTVEIIIDEFETMNGRIVRTEETGIFVSFDLSTVEEKALIAKIMLSVNEISSESDSLRDD